MIRHKLPTYVHHYKDRNGKWRIYLRRPGQPQIALPTPLFSEAFWTAYHKGMENDTKPISEVAIVSHCVV